MFEPYFATGYVRLLYRFARTELSEQELFVATGCTEADLMGAGFEMPFAAQMQLVQNALAGAAPGLGLRVGHQLQLAAHGVLGTAMQSAPDLQTALDSFARFVATRASFFVLSRSDEGETTTIVIDIDVRGLAEALIPFFTESILFTLTHCLTYYTGRQDGVRHLELAYAQPGYGSDYAGAFGAPGVFDCSDTRISFDRTLLGLPSPEVDAEAFQDSVRRLRAHMEERGQNQDILRQIENFLFENPGKLWTVEEIAPLFAVSPRTLLRRLRSRGTTFQALRDDALKRRAATYLPSMSVEATAFALGFADTSSFRRSFRRWFGTTPSEFCAGRGGSAFRMFREGDWPVNNVER